MYQTLRVLDSMSGFDQGGMISYFRCRDTSSEKDPNDQGTGQSGVRTWGNLLRVGIVALRNVIASGRKQKDQGNERHSAS